MFMSLNVDVALDKLGAEVERAVDELRAELESKGVDVGEGWWGYRLLVVRDPDGNELYFSYPDADKAPSAEEAHSGKLRFVDQEIAQFVLVERNRRPEFLVTIAADADSTVFRCRAELIVRRHQFERAFERAFHAATVFSSIQSAIAGNRSLSTRRSAMASITGQKPTR
jgi:hypothetical protein